MFNVILAATDGSGAATRAVETAADIAARYSARLVILSVVQPGPLPTEIIRYARKDLARSPHPLLANVPLWFDDAREAISRTPGELHALAAEVARTALNHGETAAKRSGIAEYETVLEHGDPAEKILECAERENADLIVIGRNGLGSFSRRFLGSITYKLMHMTDRRCLTV